MIFDVLTVLDRLRPGELQEVPPKNGYFQINFKILARGNFLYLFQQSLILILLLI